MYFESKQTTQFAQLSKEIAPPGTISQDVSYDFQFKNVEKEFESYRGINADLRYYLRVTISRSMFSMTKEQEFWVNCTQEKPKGEDPGIGMEVGLEGIVMLSIRVRSGFFGDFFFLWGALHLTPIPLSSTTM